jgi:hypothetical protein
MAIAVGNNESHNDVADPCRNPRRAFPIMLNGNLAGTRARKSKKSESVASGLVPRVCGPRGTDPGRGTRRRDALLAKLEDG